MRNPDRELKGAEPQTIHGTAGLRHETRDIFVPAIVLFLLICAFLAVIMHAGLWGWLRELRGPRILEEAADWPAGQRTMRAFPALQVSPAGDWTDYRLEQEEKLNSYGWVNQTAGVVHVPIAEAMEQVLQNGLPRWAPARRAISPLELQHQRARRAESDHENDN